jgi:hypothetical protein
MGSPHHQDFFIEPFTRPKGPNGPYINDPGYEVPPKKIVVVPFKVESSTPVSGFDGYYKEIVEPLAGKLRRDWFVAHSYYCLPIMVGNQYGFLVKSLRDYELFWDGTERDAQINFLNNDNADRQNVLARFGSGVVSIQNFFALKTAPGINLMTIQPPNLFIPGCVAMTAIIETDQIRRDFAFSFKITIPNYKITVRKGDPVGAFIPIQRYFVDDFELSMVNEVFEDKSLYENEIADSFELSRQRANEDRTKPHECGRKYFNGEHAFGQKFDDHQRNVPSRCPMRQTP